MSLETNSRERTSAPLDSLNHAYSQTTAPATAVTDDLTGLPTRRALYAGALDRFGSRSREAHALLLMDLDSVKEVNDSLGHHRGDRRLVEVSERLRTCLPSGALIARLGGDEFAVRLPAAGAASALELATSVRSGLEGPFELDCQATSRRCSRGVACTPTSCSSRSSRTCS